MISFDKLHQLIIRNPNALKWVKKMDGALFVSNPFLCVSSPDESLSLVFDILHTTQLIVVKFANGYAETDLQQIHDFNKRVPVIKYLHQAEL